MYFTIRNKRIVINDYEDDWRKVGRGKERLKQEDEQELEEKEDDVSI